MRLNCAAICPLQSGLWCVIVHRSWSFIFLFSQAEGEDNLKKMQLMELAILNGTYRDNNIKTRKWAAIDTHIHFAKSICFAPLHN